MSWPYLTKKGMPSKDMFIASIFPVFIPAPIMVRCMANGCGYITHVKSANEKWYCPDHRV